MIKDKILKNKNEKYILKKNSDYWINFWIIFSILCLFVGMMIGSNMTAQKANQFKLDLLSELKDVKYYSNVPEEQKKNIDTLIDNKLLEIKRKNAE